ncbi:MAG: adenine deaminase [Oscillibacter sp.]|jgi:adenine deaminase|nr:adenine deaminase [Oscillibacter sp.]
MTRTFEEIKTLVETGLGRRPCDRKLRNVRLVNVCSGEIYPTDIYIQGRRIVSIDPEAQLEANEVIDCGGQYALPGLIDSHMHFESTMLSPEALANLVVPKGTTTLCADLMEIANVAGEEGLRAMLTCLERLPCRMLIEVSSRVPTAPGLETTGAELDAEAVSRILSWPESVALGEMDPSKILLVKDEYLQKIQTTLAQRKIANGHAIGRMGQELNVYASAGLSDDHECVEPEELLARLRLGMRVLIREGSTERNLDALVKGVLEAGLSCENLCFCTDDKHAIEILREGHINYNINRAIQVGLDPMRAIQIATVNAARHFRVEDEIGSITPGRLADILLSPSLEDIQPSMVLFEGRVVSENGTMREPCQVQSYPDWIKDTVHLKKPVTADIFRIPAQKERVRVNLIELIDRQIINRWTTAELDGESGVLRPAPERDIAKLAVVERYGKTGGVGLGFVRGFTLRRGAMAYSMSHDHHNIVVIGCNDADMALAVNTVAELHGGLAVALEGQVLDSMALPIGGLMSEDTAEAVMAQLDQMNLAAARTGCTLPAPFMTLSFISLPTVPELGITDLGLVDVNAHRLIPLEAEEL